MRTSSDWKKLKFFRQSDRDRDRGKTIRLGFKRKGEESSEENCWREEGREGWDNALGHCGAGVREGRREGGIPI